jgi:ubiquitin C-terminal hydrolase
MTIVVKSPETQFLKEYDDLRRLTLSSSNCTVRPERFVLACRALAVHQKNATFTSFGQQDLCEFIHFVLDTLHVAMCEKEDSPQTMAINIMKGDHQTAVSESFFGVHAFTITGENIQKQTFEPFFMLDLPIPDGATTLEHCFQAATLPEEIQGYEREDKVRVAVQRRLSVEKWPTNLCISLKRFTPDGRKNDSHLQIPESIHLLKPYVLVGYGCHSGGVRSGHYTATVKVDQGWVCVDDENVYPCPHMGKGAYCLLYSSEL